MRLNIKFHVINLHDFKPEPKTAPMKVTESILAVKEY